MKVKTQDPGDRRVVCKHSGLVDFVSVAGSMARELVKASEAAMRSGELRGHDTIAYFLDDGKLRGRKASKLRRAKDRRRIATVNELKEWLRRTLEARQSEDERQLTSVA